MNEYISVKDFKDALRYTETPDDAIIQLSIEKASRIIDRFTNRRFYPKVETRKYDYPGGASKKLFVDEDLLAITTLTNGDGNAIAAANIFLYPLKGPPYSWIELKTNAGALWLYKDDPRQVISIAGRWGFQEATEDTGGTVQDSPGPLSATATSMLVQTGKVKRGWTLLVESEQIFVKDVTVGTPNDTLTIQRGVNGTTAASHVLNTAISRYLYPGPIEQACIRLAQYVWRKVDAPFERTALPELGAIIIPSALPEDVKALLQFYTRTRR